VLVDIGTFNFIQNRVLHSTPKTVDVAFSRNTVCPSRQRLRATQAQTSSILRMDVLKLTIATDRLHI
jgi:hypothetical protein